MGSFKNFRNALQERMAWIEANSVALFELDVDGDKLWDTYLASFPAGTDPIYRERSTHDCQCCRSFIRHYAGVVGIVNGKIESMWDIIVDDYPYDVVTKAMYKAISKKPIKDVFVTDTKFLGTEYNYEALETTTKRWDHFSCEVSNVYSGNKSIDSVKSEYRQSFDVIKRSFEEITPSTVDLVLDLIGDKLLERGEQYKDQLIAFKKAQHSWAASRQNVNLVWNMAFENGRFLAIRNTAIGTLLTDLSNGEELDKAVHSYNSKVDPTKYKRPKSIITSAQKEMAVKTVTELGYMDSLARRHATIEDIEVSNVLWASGESVEKMRNPFDLVDTTAKHNAKSFSNVAEVGVETFVNDILPNADSLEILFENDFENHLVNITTALNDGSKSLFKWNNPFAWSYNNGVADSVIKRAVKSHGGNTEADLRFSIMWANGDSRDNSDLDAHCKGPGLHIYFANKRDNTTGGWLDVDIRTPISHRNENIVENIAFPSSSKMKSGKYQFSVHNFQLRGVQNGFQAELEANGQLYTFNYPHGLKNGESVAVVDVEWDGTNFTVKPRISHQESSKDVWGLKTNEFVKVDTVMLSPNRWGEGKSGITHWMFMLNGCKNPEATRGFYNEFLKPELEVHRRSFEALGGKMSIDSNTDSQLAGIGFSTTRDKSIVARINSNKLLKIKIKDERTVFESVAQQVSV